MAVIQLRAKQVQPKKRLRSSASTRQRLLADLRKQSRIVAKTRCWDGHDDLKTLASLARSAGPRARSILWHEISFPLYSGLITRQVRCPDSGVPLVGVVC